MKKLMLVSGIVTALIIGGAGCGNDNLAPVANAPTPVNPEATTDNNTLTATAEAIAKGTIMVKWQKPIDAKADSTFRVLHSASFEPVLPTAYWFERSNKNYVEATVDGIPAGKRYVRVCEFNNGNCVRYSNTIEVVVE